LKVVCSTLCPVIVVFMPDRYFLTFISRLRVPLLVHADLHNLRGQPQMQKFKMRLLRVRLMLLLGHPCLCNGHERLRFAANEAIRKPFLNFL
jgi:hypothetical protein